MQYYRKFIKIMNLIIIPFFRFLPLLILCAFFIEQCTASDEKPAIDQSYLDSQKFQEFEENTTDEQSFRSDEATAFERVLSKLLIHQDTKKLQLPVQIDSVVIKELVNSSTRFELTRFMLNESSKLAYTYYPVGKTQLDRIKILFFIIEKRSVYDDCEFAVATFSDSSVVSVKSLGEFAKNLSSEVQSIVQIDKSLTITSEINRQILYPIPQDYSSNYRYLIEGDGQIKEKVLPKEN